MRLIEIRRSSASVLILAGFIAACSSNSGAARADSASGQTASSGTADTAAMVRGTVTSLAATRLVIKADTGSVTVSVNRPLHVYDREPATLADVKDNTFVGVTSVKQPDGSEQATEIHIFPDELRGLGEGSHMMTPSSGNAAARMTNGAVSGSRMTNGAVSGSRMSNGNVASTNGSTIVVQYAGGSQTITVPAGTPVTQLKQISKPLAAGDKVVVLATRRADGALTANRALLTQR